MKNYTQEEIELLKLTAIQDYLLTRGHNDEEINDKIKELRMSIKPRA